MRTRQENDRIFPSTESGVCKNLQVPANILKVSLGLLKGLLGDTRDYTAQFCGTSRLAVDPSILEDFKGCQLPVTTLLLQNTDPTTNEPLMRSDFKVELLKGAM